MSGDIVVMVNFSKEIGYKNNRILEIARKYDYVRNLIFKQGRSFAIKKEDLIKYSKEFINHMKKFANKFFDLLANTDSSLETFQKPSIVFTTKRPRKKTYSEYDFHCVEKRAVLSDELPVSRTLRYGCQIIAYDIEKLAEFKFEYDLLINKLLTIFSPFNRMKDKDFEYVKSLVKLYNGSILEDSTTNPHPEFEDGTMYCETDYSLDFSFVVHKIKLRRIKLNLKSIGVMLSYRFYTFDVTTCTAHLLLVSKYTPHCKEFLDKITYTNFDTLAREVRKRAILLFKRSGSVSKRCEYFELHEEPFELPEEIRGLPGII